MKRTLVTALALLMLSGALASLLAGCFLKNGAADGPGMVNYPGIMLDVLRGGWEESDNGSYSIIFYDDYTFSLSCNFEPLLEDAKLTLYLDNTDTDAYSEFDVNPNVFTDEAGGSVEITKASHENGTVTLELTAADGTKSTKTFCRKPEDTGGPELLDGPGMANYGGILDEAITGCWHSADGRFVLDLNGKWADFSADGVQLASKDDGYFLDHSFSEEDDLNERCELYARNSFQDDFDEPPLTISEMWYQAEHIYMNIVWPDGTAEEIVFSKQNEAAPEGGGTEAPDTAESETAPEE